LCSVRRGVRKTELFILKPTSQRPEAVRKESPDALDEWAAQTSLVGSEGMSSSQRIESTTGGYWRMSSLSTTNEWARDHVDEPVNDHHRHHTGKDGRPRRHNTMLNDARELGTIQQRHRSRRFAAWTLGRALARGPAQRFHSAADTSSWSRHWFPARTRSRRGGRGFWSKTHHYRQVAI